MTNKLKSKDYDHEKITIHSYYDDMDKIRKFLVNLGFHTTSYDKNRSGFSKCTMIKTKNIIK